MLREHMEGPTFLRVDWSLVERVWKMPPSGGMGKVTAILL